MTEESQTNSCFYLSLVRPSTVHGWQVPTVYKSVQVNNYFIVDIDEEELPLGIEMLDTRRPTIEEIEQLWDTFPTLRNDQYKRMLTAYF